MATPSWVESDFGHGWVIRIGTIDSTSASLLVMGTITVVAGSPPVATGPVADDAAVVAGDTTVVSGGGVSGALVVVITLGAASDGVESEPHDHTEAVSPATTSTRPGRPATRQLPPGTTTATS
jgi:hypothetical protein